MDTHAYSGYHIPQQYDSLLAKLIAFGVDREEATARMTRSLQEFVIEGIPTTLPFHLKVMQHPDFVSGQINTDFVTKLGY